MSTPISAGAPDPKDFFRLDGKVAFVGGAGSFGHGTPTLGLGPQLGTELAVGYSGNRLYGSYRWLAGIGGGQLDDMMTEHEAVVGFRIIQGFSVFGQYNRLNPGEADPSNALGIGAKYVF